MYGMSLCDRLFHGRMRIEQKGTDNLPCNEPLTIAPNKYGAHKDDVVIFVQGHDSIGYGLSEEQTRARQNMSYFDTLRIIR